MNRLRDIVAVPIFQAPMAGGPSGAPLAAAVSEAGGLGSLAAGYKSCTEMTAEIAEVRALTTKPFAVNVFVPHPDHADADEIDAYLVGLRPQAEELGVSIGDATWDDDDWSAKIEALVADPVAVTSFTFGCPPNEMIVALQGAGSKVIVTATNPEDAATSARSGADAICLQGIDAGGHQSVFGDSEEDVRGFGILALLAAVRGRVDVPLVAAGGLMEGRDVAAVLVAGADAAQLGTAFLRCPESGTNAAHRAALEAPDLDRTALTRAFSGRTARGVVNRFMTTHRSAPSGYPQINNATKSLRRAAAARGDYHATSLFAGQNFALGTQRRAADVVRTLMADCADILGPTVWTSG